MVNIKTLGDKLYTKTRAEYYRIFNALYRSDKSEHLTIDSPILIDTSMRTENAGDFIIMHFAEKQLSGIWDNVNFERIPCHGISVKVKESQKNKIKIVCGTNALSTCGDINCRIALPTNPRLYEKSVELLAVGLSNLNIRKDINATTAAMLKYILNDKYLHSVRDSSTERALNRIGIHNVINTSCVTMWNLTEDFCETIPREKATDVLTAITDYGFDAKLDEYMIATLKKHYRTVYLWIQGSEDLACLKKLSSIDDVKLVYGGFNGLEQFVAEHTDFDYFGTRLHCGIYCLNHGIRSMIVTIDNRAADIQVDTNIPAIERERLPFDMERLIENPRSTEIHIPEDNIIRWKRQFGY